MTASSSIRSSAPRNTTASALARSTLTGGRSGWSARTSARRPRPRIASRARGSARPLTRRSRRRHGPPGTPSSPSPSRPLRPDPSPSRSAEAAGNGRGRKMGPAMASARLSVGVPVYNGEAFLRQTLESILSQSFGDFEMIVSDNASTDDTEAIAREFAARDARVRYHRNRTNLGLAKNYNLLFSLASGEYFKWASADDV